jgi:hypothetical protein
MVTLLRTVRNARAKNPKVQAAEVYARKGLSHDQQEEMAS